MSCTIDGVQLPTRKQELTLQYQVFYRKLKKKIENLSIVSTVRVTEILVNSSMTFIQPSVSFCEMIVL